MSRTIYEYAKRFLTCFLAVVLLVSLIAVPANAADSGQDHWAADALEWAVDTGVVAGTDGGDLSPDSCLTRAQMAAMIDRLFGTYKLDDLTWYTDVIPGSWYYSYLAQAVHMGTFEGYSKNLMGPEDRITREQAMTVLARTICLPDASRDALARFPDRNDVSSWAYGAVSAMAERQYVNGYTNGWLNPQGYITRAEMVQILRNIFREVCDSGEITGSYQGVVLVRGDVDVHDAAFESDLILANSLREQELVLNNITVKGRLVVWGGSAVNVNGKSTVAGVVTPRNDGPVKVTFDAAAAELSQKGCSIVYPAAMDKGNKVTFTDKADAPTIPFVDRFPKETELYRIMTTKPSEMADRLPEAAT